jgi:hypothetical protein
MERNEAKLLVHDIISQYYAKQNVDIIENDNTSSKEAVVDVLEAPPRYFENSKMYMMYIVVGVLFGICLLSMFNFVRVMLLEKSYIVIVLLPIIPIGVIYFSFAVTSVIGTLFFVVATSSRSLERNSQYFSAIKTPVPRNATLPMIVVQMPVYKEGLEEVIVKSFLNVKKAMDYYITRGGQTKFFVCDDGLQLIAQKEVNERIQFYKDNNITFVARPPNNRKGLFKKASNMNYSLDVSLKTMEYMEKELISADVAMYKVWKDMDEAFVGYGDVTLPNDCLILLIDADTKVPETCFFDVVGEFIEDETVAYTQHYTQPFDEQCTNYWEQLISFFTKKIYMVGIAASVCMGDCAPLVGHNAFLRWASVKKVSFYDEDDKKQKFWSERHVSEDFDLYIRLASINEFGRYVMYTGDEFQEGVSLAYMDEVIKFRKFAYGACELVFNRFNEWFTKGPINKNYTDYLKSKHIKWYHKVSMSMYMSSFFAMASAFPLAILEGVCAIVKPDIHDKYMVRTFDIMLTCTFIFGIISSFGNIALLWRKNSLQGKNNILRIIWNEIKWVPLISIFFNSILFHMTTAAFTYFFDLKIVWGATLKESVNTDCITALKQTLLAYKNEYILFTVISIGYSFCLAYLDIGMYRGWAVLMYSAGHLVGPILLNPHIMSFSY